MLLTQETPTPVSYKFQLKDIFVLVMTTMYVLLLHQQTWFQFISQRLDSFLLRVCQL